MNDFFSILITAFRYDFILKALLVGVLISLCCAFLGVFLVLKKYSLIGDGLAHVGFASIAIAMLLSVSPVYVSIPIVVLSSFVILKLNEKAEVYGDAAIGLVSAFSVAAGVLIASLSGGFNVDLFSYLFGSILFVGRSDVLISVILASVVIFVIVVFYNSLFAVTFDEEFSKVIGLRTKTMNYILAVLTSVTVVIGIRIVGTMLISSMIIFPTVSSLQLSVSFKKTIVFSSMISVFCVVFGVIVSFVLNFPPGATIVLLNAIFFLVLFAIKIKRKKNMSKAIKGKQWEMNI